jgi:hypothetical protein
MSQGSHGQEQKDIIGFSWAENDNLKIKGGTDN